MKLGDRTIVVTGAASGIGRAMAIRFAKEKPRHLVCADINLKGAQETAALSGGVAMQANVAREDDIRGLIEAVESAHGPIDLFCSNAGIGVKGGAEVANEDWQRIWDINVRSHVHAARAVLPAMLERGEGYLINTASAAGLLTQIGSASFHQRPSSTALRIPIEKAPSSASRILLLTTPWRSGRRPVTSV
jgi:NAD(P)-dependent dehydrogenase (short-subunit alcohol dehydrogenase family)